MSLADVKKSAQERMVKSIDTLKSDLAKVRTGRAHTGILDHIQVEYYGSPTALTQVANVTLIDARTIGVQPFEKKMLSTIEKAIRDAEDAKIAVRNIRRDANEQLKKMVKDKTASEDEERRASDEIQKLTDKFVADIDKMVVAKEKEVLTV
jgi:ribosome recycling factor